MAAQSMERQAPSSLKFFSQQRAVVGSQRGERVAGGAQNLVPDVLRLPQIQSKGNSASMRPKRERPLQRLQRTGGHLQLDHDALHALVGDVGERGRLQRNLVGLGQREEGAQLGLVDGSASRARRRPALMAKPAARVRAGGLGRPAWER
jgi:hypothetical protein